MLRPKINRKESELFALRTLLVLFKKGLDKKNEKNLPN